MMATLTRELAMWKRLTVLWTLLRGDARRLWFALRHPAAPTWLKVGTGMILLYLLSPVDLVPDVVPVLGYADDVVVVALVLRSVVRASGAAAVRRAWPGGPAGLAVVSRLAGLPD
jgi:uncharacterized membrane protein YkvA (DUF1232 family)